MVSDRSGPLAGTGGWRAPIGGRTKLLGSAAILAVLTVAAISLVRVNQVDVTLHHPGLEGDRLLITTGIVEPLRVLVDPPRRVDGTRVTLDGRLVPHPFDTTSGRLTWDPSGLDPGSYQLRVTVPRPTWFAVVKELTVVVRTDSADDPP